MYLRWEREARFFVAHLQQDLLGDWVVTEAWGTRGQPDGRVRHRVVGDELEGLFRLHERARSHRAHGYREVTVH